MKAPDTKGFTLTEVLTSLGIFSMLLGLAMPTYNSIQDNIALSNDTSEIVNTLRTAQNDAIVSQGGVQHGVFFSSDTYTLFSGDWSAPASKTEYKLKRGVSIYAGGGQVLFERLTGQTGGATIVIGTSDDNRKTINIGKSGNISVQ